MSKMLVRLASVVLGALWLVGAQLAVARGEDAALTSVEVHAAGDDVGLIRLTGFNDHTEKDMKQALGELSGRLDGSKLKGFVLDLRNNPGGLLDQAVAVADLFLDSGAIAITRGRSAESTVKFDAHPGDLANGKPLIVLINGGTAAVAEIVAGALKENKRATLIGTRSRGDGALQTIIPLEGGGSLRLTTARMYTPSGRSIEPDGISPDIELPQNAADSAGASVQSSKESASKGAAGNKSNERPVLQSFVPSDEKADRVLNLAIDLLRGVQTDAAFPAGAAGPRK